MCTLTAKRFALKFNDPPTLFIEYADSQCLHVRAVKLKKLHHNTSLEHLTDKVIKGFPPGLDPSTFSVQQIRSLLQQLIDHCTQEKFRRSNSCIGCATRRSSSGGNNIGSDTSSDWNRRAAAPATGLSDSNQAEAAKGRDGSCATSVANTASCSDNKQGHEPVNSSQEQQHQRHAVGSQAAGGQGARYSQHSNSTEYSRQHQDRLEPNPAGHEKLDMFAAVSDIRESMDRWLDGSGCSSVTDSTQQQIAKCSTKPNSSIGCSLQLGVACSSSTAGQHAGLASQTVILPNKSIEVGFDCDDANGDCLTIEPEYLTTGEVDLNKVSDFELRMAKDRMHSQFVLNQIQPGDPAYVYDKQVDFTPVAAANDWDEDD